MKRKQKILGFGVASLMFGMMALPMVALANSSSWEFYMDRAEVNGDKNKEYHYMNAGNMKLSGSVNIDSYANGNLKIQTLNFTVKEWVDWSPDRLVGKTSVTPSKSDRRSVSATFGKQKQGKYYIVVAKQKDDDGYNISGYGDLITN
ncbi:hypothetical protein [Thermoactinomyces sp. DSM 45892]|uniref:hypothetical protein n=1 Tax=Thermoactinomyces sp. DSM 45892 TaxID=1882753 RepID=UPI00089B12B3|nr:hypothetical protein [Thermoactinomyces sp. DSM 45892]SDY85337.1 hypothetical protein SAMN05444416_10978 [Thermoactinomyces sp. DSM 45892]